MGRTYRSCALLLLFFLSAMALATATDIEAKETEDEVTVVVEASPTEDEPPTTENEAAATEDDAPLPSPTIPKGVEAEEKPAEERPNILKRIWRSFSTLEQNIITGLFCFMSFMIFAGFTGLDGGKPKKDEPKGPEVSVQKASDPSNPRVFFEIEIGGKKAGRIVFELFKTIVPKTAENFRQLCTGEAGKGLLLFDYSPLHYKGSPFHKVVPGFVCEGGDINKGDGTGGESIYGATFEDEWDIGYLKHTEPGLLTMSNSGKDSNTSQFILTLGKGPEWLDGKHVVFGKVEEGMDVVKKIEAVGSSSGKTSSKVIVADCGMKSQANAAELARERDSLNAQIETMKKELEAKESKSK